MRPAIPEISLRVSNTAVCVLFPATSPCCRTCGVQQPRFERTPSASPRPVTPRDVCARTTVCACVQCCKSRRYLSDRRRPSVRSTVCALNGRVPLAETRGETGRTVRSRNALKINDGTRSLRHYFRTHFFGVARNFFVLRVVLFCFRWSDATRGRFLCTVIALHVLDVGPHRIGYRLRYILYIKATPPMSYTLLSRIRERGALYRKKDFNLLANISFIRCVYAAFYVLTRETEEPTKTEGIGIINVYSANTPNLYRI